MSKRMVPLGLLMAGAFGLGLLMLLPFIPGNRSSDAFAIAAWSRKYKVNCQMCHSPLFARLNEYGERFLANGYQDQNEATPDGDKAGKDELSPMLHLDTQVGHWITARLNLTPVQYETNSQVVKGDTTGKLTLGNANWLQIFVAGSIAKNTSIYIENEFSGDGFHQAWFYLGKQNIGNTSWLNFQVGRLSAVVFAPYPDRLPQLPAIGGGVMRVKSSGGTGDAGIDMRSPRNGIQYYGYQGPAMLYAGVTPGVKQFNPANKIGYWAGIRFFMPGGTSAALAGSSIGIHFDGGTNTINAANDSTYMENKYTRIMPSVNVRLNDKLDLQAAYVIAKDDNWAFADTAAKVEFSGVRAVASYFINDRWSLSLHYDQYKTKEKADETYLPEYNILYAPVITYLCHENVRISLYPGFDLRDVDSKLKKNIFLINIRAAI